MTHLKAGDQAPAFEIPDQNGTLVRLSDYMGKKLVIYFYPRDNTPGCTAEACNLRDHYRTFLEQGYEILGVSADSAKSHQAFIARYELPFRLLSDTEKTMLKAYGVWGPKKFMGKVHEGIHRTTFVISGQGLIDRVITDVDTKAHSTQILG